MRADYEYQEVPGENQHRAYMRKEGESRLRFLRRGRYLLPFFIMLVAQVHTVLAFTSPNQGTVVVSYILSVAHCLMAYASWRNLQNAYERTLQDMTKRRLKGEYPYDKY